MLRNRGIYYPLILILLFGVAVSLMPASPALGSNLPSSVLVQQLNFSPSSTVRYSHTFQVGSGGTPAENGTALLAARNVISNSSPTATNPYLIKLEPGNYDLGNQSLVLPPFTDLEGSGESKTVIVSTIGQDSLQIIKATVVAVGNNELRFLKVTNTGANAFQAALLVPNSATNLSFIHLTAFTTGSSDTNVGVYLDGKNMNISDSTFTTSDNHSNFSIYHNSGDITLTNTIVNAFNGNFNNAAILEHSEQIGDPNLLTINDSTLNAQITHPLANNFVAAIWDDNAGDITINNSTLKAFGQTNGAQSFATGILNEGGIISITNSDITALNGKQSYGVFNTDFADLTVRNSKIFGNGATSYGINNVDANSVSRTINTVLTGGTAASNNVLFCPFSINGRTLNALNGACK